jgi:hypothetical protein
MALRGDRIKQSRAAAIDFLHNVNARRDGTIYQHGEKSFVERPTYAIFYANHATLSVRWSS